MDSAAKIPLSQRINFRMVAFIAIITVMFGYPVYVLIDAQVSGGIKNAAGGYKAVDLKAMSTFTFDQADGKLADIPEKWRALDGQKVILHGEMWDPSGAGSEMTGFQLVYSIAKCCVSSAPQVQHFVHSTPMKGATIHYYQGQVEVKGILHVNVKKEEGRVSSVYQLEVESVEPVQ